MDYDEKWKLTGLIALITLLVSVGISWGTTTARLNAAEDRIKELYSAVNEIDKKVDELQADMSSIQTDIRYLRDVFTGTIEDSNSLIVEGREYLLVMVETEDTHAEAPNNP